MLETQRYYCPTCGSWHAPGAVLPVLHGKVPAFLCREHGTPVQPLPRELLPQHVPHVTRQQHKALLHWLTWCLEHPGQPADMAGDAFAGWLAWANRTTESEVERVRRHCPNLSDPEMATLRRTLLQTLADQSGIELIDDDETEQE